MLTYCDRPQKQVQYLVGTEKVGEQRILVKCCKYSHFGVISNILKVATSTVTHLAMDQDVQYQEKYWT